MKAAVYLSEYLQLMDMEDDNSTKLEEVRSALMYSRDSGFTKTLIYGMENVNPALFRAHSWKSFQRREPNRSKWWKLSKYAKKNGRKIRIRSTRERETSILY